MRHSCGAFTSDTYGNTTDTLFSYGNDNANDGNLNFRQGDIFSATQKLYSEISGSTDGGMNVNLSFVGLVDPALDINAPAFKRLNSTAESDFESKFQILDAYITNSYDVGDTFVDVQLGRFVTSLLQNDQVEHQQTYHLHHMSLLCMHLKFEIYFRSHFRQLNLNA